MIACIDARLLPARIALAAVVGAAAAMPAPLAAQGPDDAHSARPERPTVGTHAGTVAPGWIELESGIEADRVAHGPSELHGPTTIKIGLAPRVQLTGSATVARQTHEPAAVEDVGVGIKWRLLDHAPIVGDLALLPAIRLTTGSVGDTPRETELSLRAVSSHDAGAVSIDVNVEYTRHVGDDDGRSASGSTLWTVSSGGPIRGPAGWTAEVYGYPGTSGPTGEPPAVALLGGPTFRVRAWLVLDVGLIVPLTGPEPHAVYAGVAYNAGRLWRAPRA